MTKNVTLLALVFFVLISPVKSCSFYPLSFCYTTASRPDDVVILGRILSEDSTGIFIEVLEVIKGIENRDTIRIWDGTDFDCNGFFSMAAEYMGAIGDTLLATLPIIDSIENVWDVFGDYRRPVYFGYICQLPYVRDSLVGYIFGPDPFQFQTQRMNYLDFKNFWTSHSNNCTGLVGNSLPIFSSLPKYHFNSLNSQIFIEFAHPPVPGTELRLWSLNGTCVKKVELIESLTHTNVSGLGPGIYLVSISSNNSQFFRFRILVD